MCLNLIISSLRAYEDDDDDDDDEEWETGKRNAKRISDGYDDGYDNYGEGYDDYGEGWNNGGQMSGWDNQGYDNFHSNGTEVRKITEQFIWIVPFHTGFHNIDALF